MSLPVPPEARYALGQHVFLCLCGSDLVMLDLVRDKYLAVEAREAAGCSVLVRGWPAAADLDARAAASTERESLLEGLLRRGLLTRDLAAGNESAAIELPTPTEELAEPSAVDERPRPRVTAAAAFVAACVAGRFLRKHRSIEQIVERVRMRKEWLASERNELDVDKVRRLLNASGALRSLFLSTRGLCLLEAIVLLEYLARYRLYPTWVFGVHTRPFAAHCWLQHENIVLNDTVEHVARYTPIMAI